MIQAPEVDRFSISALAGIVGVPVETLLEAMAPSTETMADFLATCPVINVARAEAAEAERIGGAVEALRA